MKFIHLKLLLIALLLLSLLTMLFIKIRKDSLIDNKAKEIAELVQQTNVFKKKALAGDIPSIELCKKFNRKARLLYSKVEKELTSDSEKKSFAESLLIATAEYKQVFQKINRHNQ